MANIRKELLVNNEFYHIFTRSIAKYVVFNSQAEYIRMLKLISLHRFIDFKYSYYQFTELSAETQLQIIHELKNNNNILIEIIAFCIMPTHIHLLLKQVSDNGITKFMGRILNSYSKYFNTKHQRTGPLWSSNFKNVLVSDDEQLLHLTRYIHLNPVSAGLTEKPDEWQFSSLNEYSTTLKKESDICNCKDIIDLRPDEYTKFIEDRKSYQHELSIIKSILIDDYTG